MLLRKKIKELVKDFQQWQEQLQAYFGQTSNTQQLPSLSEEAQNYNDLARCNILLIGATGVGKSTLINSIFRTTLAPAESGKPLTGKLMKYEKTGCPIIAFDSVGLVLTNGNIEQNDIEKNQQDVEKLINGSHQEFPNERIDVIYYCVSSSSDRFQPVEEEWISSLINHNIPIIIVLTKTAQQPEFCELFQAIKNRRVISQNTKWEPLVRCIENQEEITINEKYIVPVIPILAMEMRISQDYTFPQQNLDLLVKQTAALLPEQAKQVFISEQVANIDIKIQEAQKFTAVSASVSSLLALTPGIPYNATILPPTQLVILKKISSIFGLKQEEQDSLLSLSPEFQQLAGAIVTSGASSILTNLVPVAGSITDAIVAGTSTSLLCLAWIDTLKRNSYRLLDETTLTEEEIRKFIEIFQEEYRKYCNNTQ
jgi:GTPase SAR1 family protein/uncharacterized protein (DUF697 family)